MKRLIEYIEELHQNRIYDILTSDVLINMNKEINEFISNEYPKLKNDNYVELEFNPSVGELTVNFKSSFEDEMKKHYPEALI